MSMFNADSVVKPLRYNLGKRVADHEGVVPEPSEEAVQEYFEVLQTAMRKANLLAEDAEIGSAGDAVTALEKIDNLGEDFKSAREINLEVTEALIKLCAGSPSREQFAQMGYRLKLHFSKWLMGELRPEA